jgi:hypothetical protein
MAFAASITLRLCTVGQLAYSFLLFRLSGQDRTAQSVEQLATGWAFQDLNISGGKRFSHNFHSRTVHFDIIEVFTPTDAQVFLKRSIKIYI